MTEWSICWLPCSDIICSILNWDCYNDAPDKLRKKCVCALHGETVCTQAFLYTKQISKLSDCNNFSAETDSQCTQTCFYFTFFFKFRVRVGLVFTPNTLRIGCMNRSEIDEWFDQEGTIPKIMQSHFSYFNCPGSKKNDVTGSPTYMNLPDIYHFLRLYYYRLAMYLDLLFHGIRLNRMVNSSWYAYHIGLFTISSSVLIWRNLSWFVCYIKLDPCKNKPILVCLLY